MKSGGEKPRFVWTACLQPAHTQALSLREKEKRSFGCELSGRPGGTGGVATILPLPRGEGLRKGNRHKYCPALDPGNIVPQ